MLAAAMYAVFAAYPLVARPARAAAARDPYLAAVLASALFFFARARTRSTPGGLGWDGRRSSRSSMARCWRCCCASCCASSPQAQRDLGRLALVAGAALAFVTVAIPLQLDHQWITIGWALEGAALAWLYRRIPHRGLLYCGAGAARRRCSSRLALNPEVLVYEPRGAMRIFNWYLYTYLDLRGRDVRWPRGGSRPTDDRLARRRCRACRRCCRPPACILLFLLLNIEIADYYATGPAITFRFGVDASRRI